MNKQDTYRGLALVAAVGAVVSVFFERLTDFVMPKNESVAGTVLKPPQGSTTIGYSGNVELVPVLDLDAWGEGEGATALSAETRETVARTLRVPVEFSAVSIDYQLSGISPRGPNGKSLVAVRYRLSGEEWGAAECGPTRLAYRDSRDLADQIGKGINGILYKSFMKEKLTCD